MTAQSMVTLEASTRTTGGKSEARRLRRSGKLPAVAYGKGLPVSSIAVSPEEVRAILKSERGRNTVISLKVAGRALTVMIKDYAVHPVRRDLLHVDFVTVALDKEVEVDVPLIPTGKAAGIAEGGILRQVYRTVPVRCLPDRIPPQITIDISHLALGEHIVTEDLKIGEGVTLLVAPGQTLIAVVTPEIEKVEETPAAEAEAAAAAAGGAAVPGVAPGGAAPAEGAPVAGAIATPAGKDDKKKEDRGRRK